MSGIKRNKAREKLRRLVITFEKEADLGSNAAKVSLAYIYWRDSSLGPMDLKKVFYWFKLAADQGNAEALLNVASFYLLGEGVEKDVELGAKYLYAYNKKLNTGIYKSWIEMGFDEETVIKKMCRHNHRRNLLTSLP